MPKAKFVARFDIAAYYTSMRHDVIEAQVAATDLDAHQRGLIADYLALPDLQDTGQGMIASGGLSPLLGALYLTPLDRRMDTRCVGSVGTSAASTEWSAGKEASNAPGIMSVRISRGSIRPDECTVRGRLCEPA